MCVAHLLFTFIVFDAHAYTTPCESDTLPLAQFFFEGVNSGDLSPIKYVEENIK